MRTSRQQLLTRRVAAPTIRNWAIQNGVECAHYGPIPRDVERQFQEARELALFGFDAYWLSRACNPEAGRFAFTPSLVKAIWGTA